MKNLFGYICCALCLLLVTGCATTAPYDYSNLIKSNPKSILVIMPESTATDVKAEPAVLSAVAQPLSEKGYYVLPVTLVNDTFRYNGVYNSHDIRQISFGKLYEIFGADALLDISIDDYSNHYQLIDSVFVVKVTARLYDLKTGTLLWTETKESSNESESSDNLVGSLVGSLFKMAANNLLDVGYDLAKENAYSLYYSEYGTSPLLYGPYSKYYRTDEVLKSK